MFDAIRKNKSRLLLVLILVAALFFRVTLMMSHRYTLDVHELMSVEFSSKTDFSSIFNSYNVDDIESNGILYYCILNLFVKNNAVGNIVIDNDYALTAINIESILFLKVISVIASLLSCCLVYKICKKIGNSTVGIYAAFFFAIHIGNICVSDYIRFYSLNTFFCCLSTLILLNLDFDNKISIYMIISYVLSLFACTASMMCSAFLAIGHFGFCIIKYSCKNKVLKIFSSVACLHGIFFGFLWLRDIGALERKAGYLDLVEFWLELLFYNIGFGPIEKNSMMTNFYGANYEELLLNVFSFLAIGFFILLVMHIIQYCSHDSFFIFNNLRHKSGNKSMGKNSKYILLLSLSLLVFPSAGMLLLNYYEKIFNYGNTSFLHLGFVIFLAYFMYSAKRYIRWVFLIMVLASLPFSLSCISSPVILLTWEHENSCYLIKNFDCNMGILSCDGYFTVYQKENKKCFIFRYDVKKDRQINSEIEDYICSLLNKEPFQMWFSYSKFGETSLNELFQSSLFNISKRVKDNPSIVTICINSDMY